MNLSDKLFNIGSLKKIFDPFFTKRVFKSYFHFRRFPSATYGSARDFPAIKPTVGLQKFYRIDVDTEISENIFADRIAFWDSLELSDNDFNNCFC